MIINGFNKLTLLDYPNQVACIIFTKGCNYRCPFCHNGPLVLGDDYTVKEQEVLDYLDKRKGILDGIVVSGGEPLLQKDIKRFLKVIKEKGYKIKLDTNGTSPQLLQEIINECLVDYVAMDIKNVFKKYELTVGVKNTQLDNIKQCIKILEDSNIEYEFRTTIVKEFHTILDIKEICSLINKKSTYYLQNFQDGQGVIKKGLHSFSQEELEQIKKEIKKFPNVQVRGL